MNSRVVFRVCNRGVAQPGSAPGLGPGCREFESLHPDLCRWLMFKLIHAKHDVPVAQLDRAPAF